MIPRYHEVVNGIDTPFEIYKFCRSCGYAITKDNVTLNWQKCNCGDKLITARVDYAPGVIAFTEVMPLSKFGSL